MASNTAEQSADSYVQATTEKSSGRKRVVFSLEKRNSEKRPKQQRRDEPYPRQTLCCPHTPKESHVDTHIWTTPRSHFRSTDWTHSVHESVLAKANLNCLPSPRNAIASTRKRGPLSEVRTLQCVRAHLLRPGHWTLSSATIDTCQHAQCQYFHIPINGQ